MRKLLFFVFALLLPIGANAEEEVKIDGVYYSIGVIPWENYAPYAEIAGCDHCYGEIVIPEKIVWQNKTYPVTGFKENL